MSSSVYCDLLKLQQKKTRENLLSLRCSDCIQRYLTKVVNNNVENNKINNFI